MYSMQTEEKQAGKVAAISTIFIVSMIILVLYLWNISSKAVASTDIAQGKSEGIEVFTDLTGMSSASPAASSPAASSSKAPHENILTGETAIKSTAASTSSELNEALGALAKSKGLMNGTGTNGNAKETVPGEFMIPGVSLKGRRMERRPDAVSDSQEEGKVVVSIVVDAKGNVIKAEPGEAGSTTTSEALYLKAKSAALTAKFDPSAEGIEEQRGTITFVFVLK